MTYSALEMKIFLHHEELFKIYHLLMPISIIEIVCYTTKSGYKIIHFTQLHTKRATLGKKFDIKLTLLEIVWPLLHPQSGVARGISAAHQLVSLFHCLCQ